MRVNPNHLLSVLFSFTLFSVLGQDGIILQGKIDSYIQPYVLTKNFNGTILLAREGKILYLKSFGYANEDFDILNTNNTVYHIASVSKNFTSAAILLLEQKGLLSTSDLLSKFIPDFTRAEEITIHHLLTHTSGIPNINDLPEYESASHTQQTPESLLPLFKQKPLNFNPGEKYQYSNSNYNVLAYIIEKVSGKSFGEFLSDEIFKPAKMNSTGHHQNANAIIKNNAIGYQSDGQFGLEKAVYLDWSSKPGNGSLYTTAEDLLKWDQVLSSGNILSNASLDKMYKNHTSNVGYGCFVKEHLNRKRFYINGRSPGFSSYFARYPEEKVCIVVLANNYIPVATTIGMDLAAILFSEKYEIPKITASKIDSQIANILVGTYQFDATFYRPNFLMKVSKNDSGLITDWGELIPQGDYSFIGRVFWSDVSFERNGNGGILNIVYDGFKGKKVK